MNCSRCNGLMVEEAPLQPSSILDMEQIQSVPSCRCLLCGNLEDAVVLLNRMIQLEAA